MRYCSTKALTTGHLVFSTLHTNDAPSSIARLLDLGLEPFLVTATLDDAMRDMIIKHNSTQVIRVDAKKRDLRTVRECGIIAIYDGITRIEELVRETIVEELKSDHVL